MGANMKTISIQACDNGDIRINVDGKTTCVIQKNKTSDKEIFDALQYEPGCKYERGEDQPNSNVNPSIFEAVQNLFNEIVSGINSINQNVVNDNDMDEMETSDSPW